MSNLVKCLSNPKELIAKIFPFQSKTNPFFHENGQTDLNFQKNHFPNLIISLIHFLEFSRVLLSISIISPPLPVSEL